MNVKVLDMMIETEIVKGTEKAVGETKGGTIGLIDGGPKIGQKEIEVIETREKEGDRNMNIKIEAEIKIEEKGEENLRWYLEHGHLFS